MPFTNFNIEFEHAGKKLVGECTVINIPGQPEFPYKFPLYRVSLNNHLTHPDIYLYYEINKEGKRFFWYEHPEYKRRQLYKTICNALENGTKK